MEKGKLFVPLSAVIALIIALGSTIFTLYGRINNNKFESLIQDVEALGEDVENLERIVNSHESRMSGYDKDVGYIRSDLKDIKRSIISIESRINNMDITTAFKNWWNNRREEELE